MTNITRRRLLKDATAVAAAGTFVTRAVFSPTKFWRSRNRARQRKASRRSSMMCSAPASIGGTGSRAMPSVF